LQVLGLSPDTSCARSRRAAWCPWRSGSRRTPWRPASTLCATARWVTSGEFARRGSSGF